MVCMRLKCQLFLRNLLNSRNIGSRKNTLSQTVPGGVQSRNHAYFFHFHAIPHKFLSFPRIIQTSIFTKSRKFSFRFHAITHTKKTFYASRTEVDLRNHAIMFSFSRYHVTKKDCSRNHAYLWVASSNTGEM